MYILSIAFYDRLYLAGRGITTNEAFKWEMIEESVDRGDLYKLVPAVKEETRSTAIEDTTFSKRSNGKAPVSQEKQQIRIKNFDEIENIYDKGFIGNLKEVFFPPRF
jgi:palmitoyltransferase